MINLPYFTSLITKDFSPLSQECLDICLEVLDEYNLNNDQGLYILATLLYETDYFTRPNLVKVDTNIIKIIGEFPLISLPVLKRCSCCIYIPTTYNTDNEKDFETTIQVIITSILKGLYTGYPLSKFIDRKNILDLYNARKVVASLDNSRHIVDIFYKLKLSVEN